MRTLFVVSGKTGGRLLASALLATSFATTSHATTWIYGTPSTSVEENWYYGFQSWAKDNDGHPVQYGIKNKPSWATFNTEYGHLYGIPTAANVGQYSNIVIYATDGISTAYLPPFSITVTGTGSTSTGSTGGGSGGGSSAETGSATVSWMPPTENTNGSTLTNLAGYTISYGTNSKSLSSTVQVANAGLTTYVVEGLPAGTYYFAVSAYTAGGVTSSLSNIASKTIN